MRVTIGKHTIPLGLIGAILSILFLGAFAAYLLTVSIPLTVQEPIEILGHPEALGLYPGETIDFNTTLQNHASLDYALFLNFYLDNTTYQQSYVTTSNETYIVHPGVQNLSSWLKVSANATPRSSVLTVSFHREAIEDYAQESLWIGDINFGIGAGDGWITFTVLNTGTVAVTIKEFRVNNQKVNTTSPALPTTVSASSNTFAELSGLTIVSGHSYEVTCLTSKGNLFSKSAVAPQPWGVFLYKANVNFYASGGVKKIDVDIGNSGSVDTNITRVYIGTSASTLQNQTITSVKVPAGAGDPARITVNYDWADGSTYYFKVISSSGQSLDWPEQAPEQTEQVNITNMAFATGTPGSILVVANNTGTSSVTINEIWVNNQKQNTISPTIPTKGVILANQGLAFNITMNVYTGYSYQVKLVSSRGTQFLYTGTAPT